MEDYAWEYTDETAQEAEELRLPRVTWYNGNSKMKTAGGIVYTGGMTARRESLGDGLEIPNWTIGSFEPMKLRMLNDCTSVAMPQVKRSAVMR